MTYSDSIVVFGAGCIGRGLIGELAQRENRPLIFVEVISNLAQQLTEAGNYKVRLVGREESETIVSGYKVIMLNDKESINQAIRTCSFVVTAVGGAHLELVGKTIAPAILGRDKTLEYIGMCKLAKS